MKDLLLIVAHLSTTLAKLLEPGVAKAIIADSLHMNRHLLIANRSGQRAPNLAPVARMLLGLLNVRWIWLLGIFITDVYCLLRTPGPLG